MDHGVADLDSRPEAVDQDTSGLLLQDGHEAAGDVVVRSFQMERYRQLPFQRLDDLDQLILIPAPHDQRRGPEDLLLKCGMAQEILSRRAEQRRLPLETLADNAFAKHLNPSMRPQAGNTL